MPKQVVAVVGQALSIPISVSDLDQDALTFSANGLPIDAHLTPSSTYGQAILTWIPTTDDIGLHDIIIQVADSGLSPQDAGYTQPEHPVPNIVTQTLRVVVRDTNATPNVLGVQVNGIAVDSTSNSTTLNATEGIPLTFDIYTRDSDGDLLNWTAANLPVGMVMDAADSSHIRLRWTPDLFATQTNQGHYSITVQASDGNAAITHSFTINVANTNQTPKMLPMPLQLVREGDTLSFTVRTADADGDAVRLSLIHDENTPSGVFFDPATGLLEWTPSQDTVNNATDISTPFTLHFSATDGQATNTQSVQVRVLDVNRTPKIFVGNHAITVGQNFSLPISLVKPTATSTGLNAWDEDGTPQTQALTLSFTNLPEGASYNAQTQRLSWATGPGQTGTVIVTANVSDGKNTAIQTFTLKVVADAHANAPKVLVSTTPSTPALPGQRVVATIRADSYAPIQSITVQVRGSGLGSDLWQTVSLDSAGRMRLTPTNPGLIDIQVTAIDQDGFSTTETQSIRVKDPSDTQAPIINWGGALLGSTASSQPITLTNATALTAQVQEQQFMAYTLSIAPAPTQNWQILNEQFLSAVHLNGALNLTNLDPATLPNGVYTLRLTASDLAGRSSEIEARIIIDTVQKTFNTAQATDAIFTLAGHDLAFTRTLNSTALAGEGDFANWQLPMLDTHLTYDQLSTTDQGTLAPWQEGAKLWLQIPSSLSTPTATIKNLSFTLSTTKETLGTVPGAPAVYHPIFNNSQGFTLTAHTSDNAHENLQRQGSHLYDQNTGLSWNPTWYTLTAPDGTRYELDAQGKVSKISFADGVQWLVSDTGIAAITGHIEDRIDFIRDDQGRISRIGSESTSIVYRYDAQNRLILARHLTPSPLTGEGWGEGERVQSSTMYAYDSTGKLLTDIITANLGAAVSWNTTGSWQGSLTANQSTTLSFTVRDSELASTVKAPGAQGAVIVAIESEGDAAFEVTGATILGTATNGVTKTTLIRITEAGLKLIRVNGSGTASIHVLLAGDLNTDGKIDGIDSQLFNQGAADIDGNGQMEAADRQILYANYGWKANQAPVIASVLPETKTHTDLSTNIDLHTIADDLEGDSVFWKVLSTTHGTAKLSSDGQTLWFTPETGYSGAAKITVQADDGFAASVPVELAVNVSGAKLLAIHLAPILSLQTGQVIQIQARGDFEDEKGVQLNAGSYLTVATEDISGLGYVGSTALQINDIRDLILAKQPGSALLSVSRVNSDGQLIRVVSALNVHVSLAQSDLQVLEESESEADASEEAIIIQPDVYPGTLTLLPGLTRQLKVHLIDPNTGEVLDIHTASQQRFAGQAESTETETDPETGESFTFTYEALPAVYSGTRYISSDESVATVSANGLLTAHKQGRVTISIIHLNSSVDNGQLFEQAIGQTDILLTVQLAQEVSQGETRTIIVMPEEGGAIKSATGETVLIGAGALKDDTAVSIKRIDLNQLQAETGLQPPASSVLQAIGAFKLEMGEQITTVPLQLVIPLQNQHDVQPGDEVLFFRHGQVLQADGSLKDTWWLVDNGYITDDYVARTASPPYAGVDSSGEYVVSKRLPGIVSGSLDLSINEGSWLSFDAANVVLGGGLSGMSITSEILGLLASTSDTATAGSYYFGVPQFVEVEMPQVEPQDTYELNLDDKLPPVQTPFGNVSLPQLTGVSVDLGSSQLRFMVSNPSPGLFAGEMILRMQFTDGTHKDFSTLYAGNADGEISIAIPDNIAVGSVGWQLVRKISTAEYSGTGHLSESKALEFAGNTIYLQPKADMAAVLTRTGVDFYRQNTLMGQTNLLDKLGLPNNFDRTYLTGTKVQPVAYSGDLSRVFVGGNGVVFVIDTLTYKLISTVAIPGGSNISSLVSTGSALIIGESGKNARLLLMDTNPGSKTYNQVISIKNTGVEQSPNGMTGMAIGPDGKTLVVAVPETAASVSLGGKRGSVLVMDLSTLNFKTGQIGTLITAILPTDGMSGKSPQTIQDTYSSDRFLISSTADFDRGLSTLQIKRSANGTLLSAQMTAINLSQPTSSIIKDRLDIQRTQSAVLVHYNGEDYAIVSDDNYNFNDPYW
ncbi:MAG: putative Ig domain-containing protein [Pseudomonadota bacterium]